jgi:hypothetical protein
MIRFSTEKFIENLLCQFGAFEIKDSLKTSSLANKTMRFKNVALQTFRHLR